MNRLPAGIIAFATCLIPTAFSAAQEEAVLEYDNGEADGALQDPQPGAVEAWRFTPLHPARLERIEMMFAGTLTPVSVAVANWDHGHQADFQNKLIEWQTVTPAGENEWTAWDVSGEGLELEPYHEYFVILELGETPTQWAVDIYPDAAAPPRSIIWIDGDWYAFEDAMFLVRATVLYHDQVTETDFRKATEEAGLAGLGGRFAFGDYDNDGDDDLLANGNRLFRNDGGRFTEVSDEAGIAGRSTGGGVWADYDNDGFLDFYATSGGAKGDDHDLLWHNNGDGTFRDVTVEAGNVFDYYPSEAAAWADYNGDGLVDLYVANYEIPGNELAQGTPDIFWQNLGNGKFFDMTDLTGLSPEDENYQCGRGLAWADFDNDRDQDLYVANYRLDPNYFFVNQGYGTFEDEAEKRGVQGDGAAGQFGHTIGAAWGDIDNDGDLDLFAANLAHPRFEAFSDKSLLYLNSGAPDYVFSDIREQAGIFWAETHSDPSLIDYDNDGDLDLFITCVYEDRFSYLYRNNGNLTFTEVSYPTGAWVLNGWGQAWADVDDDGRLDLVAGEYLHNETRNAGHYLKVRLHGGGRVNQAAIGSRVVVEAGAQKLMREVEGGQGTGCQNSLTLHFGLGEAREVDRLTVSWTDGTTTEQTGLKADQTITIYRLPPEENPDGGEPAGDGGLGADGGVPPETSGATAGAQEEDGCGCRTGGSESTLTAALLFAALLLIRPAPRATP